MKLGSPRINAIPTICGQADSRLRESRTRGLEAFLASDQLGHLRTPKALPSSRFSSMLGLHHIKNTVQQPLSKVKKRNTSSHLAKTKLNLNSLSCSSIFTTSITFLLIVKFVLSLKLVLLSCFIKRT